jgi:predicted double-glycine peptidase
MNLLVDAIVATAFATSGALLGYWFSRLPKSYWMLGYFIPLLLIAIYGVAIHYPVLPFTPPISWMMMGLKKFAVVGFIAAMILATLAPRLPRKRDRVAIVILVVAVIFGLTAWPFLAPAFNRRELAHLSTHINSDGVCRQSTDYTCGPAAAVTALHKLGFPAEEGQIAILSYTSSETGTPPDILAEALQKHYGKNGLIVEYRPFKSIAELKQAGLTLAVTKFSFMVDHYVTVLDVTDSEVIVGDPLSGLKAIPYENFRREWRFVGIVLRRQP